MVIVYYASDLTSNKECKGSLIWLLEGENIIKDDAISLNYPKAPPCSHLFSIPQHNHKRGESEILDEQYRYRRFFRHRYNFYIDKSLDWTPTWPQIINLFKTVLVLSHNYFQSSYCNREYTNNNKISLAIKRRRKLKNARWYQGTCLDRTFSIAFQMGRIRPPNTFTSCSLFPTVQ